MKADIYFVLNGLLNGESGVYAKTCGIGEQQPDGWYFMFDGMDDGIGPYGSREDAEEAYRDYTGPYVIVVQYDDSAVQAFGPFKTRKGAEEGCEEVKLRLEEDAEEHDYVTDVTIVKVSNNLAALTYFD